MKKKARNIGVFTTACVGSLCALCWQTFNRMLVRRKDGKKPLKALEHPESDYMKAHRKWLNQQPMEEVYIKSFDGLSLYGRLYIPEDLSEEENPKTIILCVHGYQTDGPTDFAPFAPFYKKNHFIYCLIDHRAHGKSEGKYIGLSYQEKFDVLKWANFLVKRFGSDCQIYLHGVSMGGSTVLSCCDQETLPPQVKGIISDCAFSNGWTESTLISKNFLHLPPFPLLYVFNGICKKRAGYDIRDISPIDAVAASKVPILFIHGDRDRFVPTKMSYQLYHACRSPKQLLIIHGASHMHCYKTDPDSYEKAFLEFIEKTQAKA